MKKIFEGCLLLTDMDGTLIQSPDPITEENIKAIDKFIEHGGKFAIATGRSPVNAFRFLSDINLNAPSILFNGGMIYDRDSKEVVREHFMPTESTKYIEEISKEFPDLGIEIIDGAKSYRTADNDIIKGREEREQLNYIDIAIDKVNFNFHKSILGYAPEKMQKLTEYVKGRLSNYSGVNFVNSSAFYLEVLPKGVDKGSALIELSEVLKIKRENVFAIGDFHNDIEMLNEAAISAAPSTAHPDILGIVDVVVGDHKKHAVADFINYLFDIRAK